MKKVELTNEQHAWLLHLIEQMRQRARRNASIWVDQLDLIDGVRNALSGGDAIPVPEPQTRGEAKPRKPRGKRRSSAERLAALPRLCPEHPAYGAQRRPRTDCESCWKAFEKLTGPAAAQLARRAFDRKQKD